MIRRLRRPLLLVLGLLTIGLIAAACGGDDDSTDSEGGVEPPEGIQMADGTEAETDPEATLELTSSAFSPGEELPVELTCDGAGDSPPLEWSGVPEGTDSLALLLVDPDAPGANPFLHASVLDIPPDVTSAPQGGVPTGGTPGPNESGEGGYIPPCPPEGDGSHTYVFSISALTAPVDLADAGGAAEFIQAIDGTATASAELTATYER